MHKLNLGSGGMLRNGYINFDKNMTKRGDKKTDVIGDVLDIAKIYSPETFDEILCAHVIEHFELKVANKILKDCYSLLKKSGKLIMEGPDIIGIIQLYNEAHPIMDTPEKVIQNIYGSPTYIEEGLEWLHKWGWTHETMSAQMKATGFKVIHEGIGQTHGMGRRDFRVVGIR